MVQSGSLDNGEPVGYGFGWKVTDLDANTTHLYTIVFPSDADFDKGRISILSPLGTALLGYRAGDVITWDMPRGTRKLRIEELVYAGDAAAPKIDLVLAKPALKTAPVTLNIETDAKECTLVSGAESVLFAVVIFGGRVVDEMLEPTAQRVLDRMKHFDAKGRTS